MKLIKKLNKNGFLPSDRNSKVENGKRFGPHFFYKQITEDCWCNGSVTGLTNTNQGSHGYKTEKKSFD